MSWIIPCRNVPKGARIHGSVEGWQPSRRGTPDGVATMLSLAISLSRHWAQAGRGATQPGAEMLHEPLVPHARCITALYAAPGGENAKRSRSANSASRPASR